MFEPKANTLSVQYAPADGSVAEENPPVMVWLPENDYLGGYQLQIATDDSFADHTLVYDAQCAFNFHRPPALTDAGRYVWRYCKLTQAKERSDWSSIRCFIINESSLTSRVADIPAALAQAAGAHPRLMVGNADGLAKLKAYADKQTPYWEAFLNRSVASFSEMTPHDEPQPYPNNQRDVALWRKYYIEAQEYFYVIRHCAVAGTVQQDSVLLEQAKTWLIAMAQWDVHGASSRHYNDEVGFRVIITLAWGYDWLHNQLSEPQRHCVQTALQVRTQELFHHLTEQAKIHIFPYDSHAIRAISAALVPAAIALHGEVDEAAHWLDYSVNYLYSLYSPWSGVDGGWGEGPHYWTTAMAYLLDAVQMIEAYTQIDLYQRPIIKNTGDFPLFTKSPGARRAYFGDDSTLGEQATIKTAVCMLHLSGALNRPDYHWFYQQHAQRDVSTGKEFYNYGWWDTDFDRLLIDFYFDVPEPTYTLPTTAVKWFKSIGWVSIQHKLNQPEAHMQFTIKSSPLGSVSHSSADQGAFVLYGFEEDLAIHSGYYVSYGSTMHTQWRKQTKSKNALLINGQGQYAGSDKVLAKQASGQVLSVEEAPGLIKIETDNTAAYQSVNSDVLLARRDVYFVNEQYFLIVDRVACATEQPIQIRQHSEQPFYCSTKSMITSMPKAAVEYSVAYSSAKLLEVSSGEGFDGVNATDYEDLAMNYVGEFSFAPAKTHRVVTLVQPYRRGEKKSLYTFVDDQGFNLNVYVTDEQDNSFKLEVPKV
ncbi:MAG: DUF4962 domain-containing protein [Reinekea sp.]|nr:DUF4962 domain-containing protein [Reinekea sp.]